MFGGEADLCCLHILLILLLVPAAPNRLPPMAPSRTPPNATETGSTASWTSSPACCPSLRRSGLGWTSCRCCASASDTWRSRASSTVSPRQKTATVHVMEGGGLSPIAQRVTGNYVRTQRSDLIFQFRLLPTMLLFPVFKGAIQTIFFSVPLCVLVAASHDFLVMGLRFGKVLQTSLEKRKYAVE